MEDDRMERLAALERAAARMDAESAANDRALAAMGQMGNVTLAVPHAALAELDDACRPGRTLFVAAHVIAG